MRISITARLSKSPRSSGNIKAILEWTLSGIANLDVNALEKNRTEEQVTSLPTQQTLRTLSSVIIMHSGEPNRNKYTVNGPSFCEDSIHLQYWTMATDLMNRL